VPKPKVIIFDLDDTLIAWSSATPALWTDLCREYEGLCGVPHEELYRAIRETGDWYWSDAERHRTGRLDLFKARRILVGMALQKLGIGDEALASKLADEFSHRREVATKLFPESLAVLALLRERGYRLGLITNGAADMQRAKLERFALEPYFDCIVIEGEFGTGKPEPAGFLHILKCLNATGREAWMVGDDLERDLAPCAPLGIFSSWLDGAGNGVPADSKVRPDRVIRDIAELPGLLEEEQ